MNDLHKTSRNWTRILLVASLALNLAVIGMVAGVALGGGPKERLQRFDLTVGPLTRAMEGDQRDGVRDALRDSGAFRPADRASMRRDMNVLLDSLRADDFNEGAFRAVLTRQRVRLQSGQDAVLEAVAAQIGAMDATERAAFADRLEDQLRRGREDRGDSNRSDRSGG